MSKAVFDKIAEDFNEAIARGETASHRMTIFDPYGRSPAVEVVAELKAANAEDRADLLEILNGGPDREAAQLRFFARKRRLFEQQLGRETEVAQMSKMVERVKAAIAAKLAPAIDVRAPYAKVMIEEAARDAIAAMREPTEAMTGNAKRLRDHPRFKHYDAAFVWRAMIDAALDD